MSAENLDNKQINESAQESQENLTEQTLNDPEAARDTAESISNSWDLDNLTDKEISNVNAAKELIKQKNPNLNTDNREDYQIINQAKKIQKEMQALRRFENKKQNFEVKDSNNTILHSFSYREENWEIIATINGSQEVHYKKSFSTWNETFDNKLDPKLKNYLDAITYSETLYELSNFLGYSNIFKENYWEESDFSKVSLEMRAKAQDLRWKVSINNYFDNPNNATNFINTFKDFSPEQLNTNGFIELKCLIASTLRGSKDYTFSYRDFTFPDKLNIDHWSIITTNEVPSCNAKITEIDNNWIHLKNSVTWQETVFNTDTFTKAKNAKVEKETQRDYIKNKRKEIMKRLEIDENTDITREDRDKIRDELLFEWFTKDKKIFDIFYNEVLESNARWFGSSIDWEDISWLLKRFNIQENISWRWSMSAWNINWKGSIKVDFWNTQIYLAFWEQPTITHKKVTQEQINETINEEEKSINYKRALNIIETSKNSWKIDLSLLNLTSKEVGNLFAESNLKDINNLEIDLSWNRISTIPKILFQNEWIKSLDLSRNLITEISTDIFEEFDKNKCNLKDLSLDWNNINQIPEELFRNVYKLQSFSISNKNLTKIPDSIWNLSGLQKLNISNTWIESIPNSIINCKNLEKFYADFCKLNNLPEWLWELTNLKFLDLSDNNLTSIPDLSKLINLEHLDISYNKNLQTIPEVSYNKLETLDITWCNNTIPPIEQFKNNINKLYTNVSIWAKEYNDSWIDTWEEIKEWYFSWPDNNEKLSWNPNEFFDDNEEYIQLRLTADSLDSWLWKAKQTLWIEDKTPIFYTERKRSDWTISIHIFTKKDKK